MKFTHKGLQRFYEKDDVRGVHLDLVARIRRRLAFLADARTPREMDIPGYRLHPLKGNRQGHWSVHVSGNWRIVFRFEKGEAVDVDLMDYH